MTRFHVQRQNRSRRDRWRCSFLRQRRHTSAMRICRFSAIWPRLALPISSASKCSEKGEAERPIAPSLTRISRMGCASSPDAARHPGRSACARRHRPGPKPGHRIRARPWSPAAARRPPRPSGRPCARARPRVRPTMPPPQTITSALFHGSCLSRKPRPKERARRAQFLCICEIMLTFLGLAMIFQAANSTQKSQ